jgi:uncharacterized protein (DUF362 family)
MPKVSLVKVPEKPFDDEVYAAVRQAVEMIGGPAAFAKAGQKVLIKPNWWCWPAENPREQSYMHYGTTDRRVVFGAARLFVELGCQVMIGEEPAVNRLVKRVYDGFKAQELAQRAGAQLVDLRAAGYRTVPAPAGRLFKELRISTVALEADLIVSVPMLKSHNLVGVTVSLKNMKGILPSVEKRAFHQLGLSQGIADLATVVKPALTVVDAIIGSDNWVVGGGLRPMGLILAGDDPVATDAVCCHLMQADPYQIDHIRLAAELGVGEIALDKIDVRGVKIDDVSIPFMLPADPLKIAQELDNVQIIVGEACSDCLNRLGDVFAQMGREKLAAAGPLTFVVGKGAQPTPGRHNILMGVCTAAHRSEGVYLPNCPPMIPEVMAAIHCAAGEQSEIQYFWDNVQMAEDV